MSRKYFISANVTLFKTTYFSYHGLQLENNLSQSKFITLLVVIDTFVSKTDKPLHLYPQKRLVRESGVYQTQFLPPPDSLMDDHIPPPIFVPLILDDPNLLIAPKKGNLNCTHYPWWFAHVLSSISTLKSYKEALNNSVWKKVIEEEMHALLNRGTWELVDLPQGKDVIGCHWAFTIKYHHR